MGYILSAVVLITITLCTAILFHISFFLLLSSTHYLGYYRFFLLVSRRVNYVY